jgi:hypothetical protein
MSVQLKTRTTVVAWLFLLGSIFSLACFVATVPHWDIKHAHAYFLLGVYSLPVPLWVGILGKWRLAWSVLVAYLSIMLLSGIVQSAAMHHAVRWWYLPASLSVLAVTYALPLWILLTDRPSDWIIAAPAGISSPGETAAIGDG